VILVYAIDSLWTLIALFGIEVSTWALLDGFADRHALHQANDYEPKDPRTVIVRLNLRSASASLLLHCFFLVLGYLAITATVRPRPSLFYVLLAGGYILVAATNVRAVGLNQLERWRLRRQ